MENVQLTLSLKTYLDDKFNGIERRFEFLESQIKNIETKLDAEHDVALLAEKDILYVSNELSTMKQELKICKESCERRKTDLEERVLTIIQPSIDAADAKRKVVYLGIILSILLSITGFVLVKFFIAPIEQHLDQATMQKQEVKKK